MVFSRSTFRIFRLGRSRIDYAKEIGDGLSSSVVAAPVLWMARTFPEAPPALWPKTQGAGQEELERDHAMLRLLERPNDFYSGVLLWMATVVEWMVNGDAYWLKERAAGGRVVRLWYAPSWTMEPEGEGDVFITHYVYTVEGEPYRVEPRDVVHFRNGMDPWNPRRGCSPLRSVLREIFTDEEAAAFTAALLRNMGVPGLLISPDSDGDINVEEAEETKAKLKAQFTGDNRGEPLVLTSKTKVQEFGFSPEQLTMRDLRRVPEERVTAVLGVPAIVAGLGAGLERSTFTNMAEAREAAYESGVIPMQRILAEDVRFQLLPDFEGTEGAHGFTFGFDLSKVRVLQEDMFRQAQRHAIGVREGVEMRSEYRRALGLKVDDTRDNVFLVPSNITVLPADEGRSRTPAPSTNGATNGATTRSEALEIAREVAEELDRRQLAEPREAR